MAAGYDKAKLKNIIRRFGLSAGRVTPYSSYYKPIAAYRVSTGQGDWVLKPQKGKFSRFAAQRRIKAVVVCIRKLEKAKYPHMPRWRRTNSSRYWVLSGGIPFYMTEWVEGRKLSQQPAEFEELGRALARLHLIGRSLPGRSYTRSQQRLLRSQDLRFRKHLILLSNNKSSAGEWLAAHGLECKTLADRGWRLLRRPETIQTLVREARRAAFIHGDVTVPNVVVAANGVKLIDWDTVQMGSTYMEIVRTLSNVTGFHTGLMQALLRGYEEVKPLAPGERLVIAGLFRLPREAWYTARALVNGRIHNVFPTMRQLWPDRLQAAQWLDEWAGGSANQSEDGHEKAALGIEIPDEPIEG